jgi:8-oxo-dGTP pyrophosphatase MutT (NUDIX family)
LSRDAAAALDATSLRQKLLAVAGGCQRLHGAARSDGDRAVAAAVLVPFVLGPTPGVLLTRRGQHLSSHAGQVSFPGGRIEPDDAGPEAAALREAQEEVGLDPAHVEVLGCLDDYLTGTGFRVTPVLAVLPAGLELEALALRPSPREVDAVFELPLSVLLDPDAPQLRFVTSGGRERHFWVWPHPQHYIWGATAAILVNLAERLRAAETCSG